MKRAAVIIGVDKTGDLPRLKDAGRGAQLMASWAREQGMSPVHVFTDDNKKRVEVSAIKTAIRELVDAANVGQLFIYFAGHGVNRQRHEYWLLSDAPDDTQAAVNVAGSVALAGTCGIPHVVLVSDACRTAAEGVRAQSITGSEIFPNREGEERPVDLFFACQLGRPSHEVRDPAVTSAEFKALYTNELVPALAGRRAQVLEWTAEGNAKVGLVRLRPLRDYMASAVATKLQGLNLQTSVIQVPVAFINSDPPAWISRVTEGDGRGGSLGIALAGRRARPLKPAVTTATITTSLLSSALSADASMLRAAYEQSRASGVAGASDLVGSAELLAQPFGPTLTDARCAFKIRGARIVAAHARGATTDVLDADGPRGEAVRMAGITRPGASVLLVFDSGVGVAVPAIPDFIGALTVEDGELVDVAYEPSENTWRWGEYAQRSNDIRALRALAASSLTRGAFRLEGDEALQVARRMQYAKSVDPSLAVYAAYAYHGLQRLDLIRETSRYMEGDLGAPLFDVALLARRLNGKRVGPDSNVLGAMPLLAQGWALLSAFDVSLPPALAEVEKRLVPSLWTMLDARGVELVRAAIASGAIR